jgi:hypothetical protein
MTFLVFIFTTPPSLFQFLRTKSLLTYFPKILPDMTEGQPRPKLFELSLSDRLLEPQYLQRRPSLFFLIQRWQALTLNQGKEWKERAFLPLFNLQTLQL